MAMSAKDAKVAAKKAYATLCENKTVTAATAALIDAIVDAVFDMVTAGKVETTVKGTCSSGDVTGKGEGTIS